MLHHVMPILPSVYMIKDDLHPALYPANLTRLGYKTLLRMDRAALMAEVILWVILNMTNAERVAIRIGYGVSTDLDVPFNDDLLDGIVADAVIPSCLQLPADLAQRTA